MALLLLQTGVERLLKPVVVTLLQACVGGL